MTAMVPIAMFGWPVVSIVAFKRYPPQIAVLICVIGGALFLPVWEYKFPLLPEYSKSAAIAVGLLLGELASGSRNNYKFVFTASDIPMLIWCTFSPLFTVITNGLSLKDAILIMITNYLNWGVLYWAGKRYFLKKADFILILKGFIIGGILYLPLVLFESRMAPILSIRLYGFFAHDWTQHIRYGGYRPIVFMNHGLMVALWMAICTILTYWAWRTKLVPKIWKVPTLFIFTGLAIGTVFTKSSGSLVLMMVGIAVLTVFHATKRTFAIKLLCYFIIVYILFRLTNRISVDDIISRLSKYFHEERLLSLQVRLMQEDLFGRKALLHPIFGWGGYGRGWPTDPYSGKNLIGMVDALWIILFSQYGIVGLVCIYSGLIIGPMIVVKKNIGRIIHEVDLNLIGLSVGVLIFGIDCLLNAMINPVYILLAGALCSIPEK